LAAPGGIIFAIVTGLLMAFIFRKDDAARTRARMYLPTPKKGAGTLLQQGLYILTMS
jgi:hypothetical protein